MSLVRRQAGVDPLVR